MFLDTLIEKTGSTGSNVLAVLVTALMLVLGQVIFVVDHANPVDDSVRLGALIAILGMHLLLLAAPRFAQTLQTVSLIGMGVFAAMIVVSSWDMGLVSWVGVTLVVAPGILFAFSYSLEGVRRSALCLDRRFG